MPQLSDSVQKALDEIERQLYSVNARNISMRWIGMRKKPTPGEILELNAMLSFIILEIRTLKETGELDIDALHKKEFPELY